MSDLSTKQRLVRAIGQLATMARQNPQDADRYLDLIQHNIADYKQVKKAQK